MKVKYRVTKLAKALIIQFVICALGIICGFTWEAYDENFKLSKLFYPGVKTAKFSTSKNTKNIDIEQLKSQLIDKLSDFKLDIKIGEFVFVLDCSKLIKSFNIDSLTKENNGKFLLHLDYNEEYLDSFISNIENKVNKEPANAKMDIGENGSIEVIDDEKGIKLKSRELVFQIKDIISKGVFDSIEIIAPFEEINADIKGDMLSLMNARIASATTDFSSSTEARENNINIASDAINGIILGPGDIFSFNETVGEITEENGFDFAPVLQGVDYKSGVGGGICQVSSTLYNVVLRSGLTPLERKSHSLPLSYVEPGMDATIYGDTIDLKFKNSFNYPICIESYIKDKELFINFYSNNELNNKEYVLESDVYDVEPAKIKIINDKNLASGKTVIERKGSDGYWVMVTRKTYEKGELTDSEIISDDYYKAVDTVVRKGIGN